MKPKQLPPPSTARVALARSVIAILLLAILPVRVSAAINDSCETAMALVSGVPVLVNTGFEFTEEDLLDLSALANKLDQPPDVISGFVRANLSTNTLLMLEEFITGGSTPNALALGLVRELNEIIEGEIIYEETRFAGVSLAEETQALLDLALPGGETRKELNRLLLEDAYPLELRKSALNSRSACGFLGRGVWFTFTPTDTCPLLIRTCHSDFDTVLEVYSGNCNSLANVPNGCVDDDGPSCRGLQASVIVEAVTGVPLYILAGGYGGHSGSLSLSVEPLPDLTITPASQDQVEITWRGSPGSLYQLESASNMIGSVWQTVPDAPIRIGSGAILTNTVSAPNGNESFRLRFAGRAYGITDVMLTDSQDREALEVQPADYAGLGVHRVTRPFVPGEAGKRRAGEAFIGSFATRIWVRYTELSEAVAIQQGLLTDIAVTTWFDGIAQCPEAARHVLIDSVPCPDGWQRANGPTNVPRQGELSHVDVFGIFSFSSGLCVRYRPASEIVASNELFIERLSLGNVTDKGAATYPHRAIGWQYDPAHIMGTVDNEPEFKKTGINLTYSRRSPIPAGVFSDAQKLELLTRYAPQIWLPAGERFNPSSVEWAFQYLDRYLASDGNWWLRTKVPVELNKTPLTGGSLEENNPFYHGDWASAPIYAYWVEKDGPSTVDLVYFAYFPWNNGKKVKALYFGHHVSDFEHVTVRLKDGQPSAIYFSAHDFGQNWDWKTIPKTEGTHPIVFAADGSHGMWPTAGTQEYELVTIPGIEVSIQTLTDETSAGTAWRTWQRVEAYDYTRQQGLGGTPWPTWMSTDYSNPGSNPVTVPGNGPIYRWGNPATGWEVAGYLLQENGPTGPPAKGVWNSFVFE